MTTAAADPASPAKPAESASPGRRPRRFGRGRAKALLYLVFVVVPSLLATAYLYLFAEDQYASNTAFSVRTLDGQQTVELIGLLSQAGGTAAGDSFILYDFIRSQPLVEKIDKELDLRAIYNRPESDWVFRLGEDRTIEELVEYWNVAVTVSYDNSSSIIYVEAIAFDPEDARRIGETIVRESEQVVNRLSEQARADAVSFAELEVEKAEERLQIVRRELDAFRVSSQEVDPSENAKLAIGLVASLEAQLATDRAELSTLRAYLGPEAPSVRVVRQRISSLEEQIAAERSKLASADVGANPLSADLFRYEELVLDRVFAENYYTGTLNALTQAQAEARRQQRYLATHIAPTLPEEAIYPRRALLSVAVFVTLSVLWSILNLLIGNVRDRA